MAEKPHYIKKIDIYFNPSAHRQAQFPREFTVAIVWLSCGYRVAMLFSIASLKLSKIDMFWSIRTRFPAPIFPLLNRELGPHVRSTRLTARVVVPSSW